MSMWVRVDFFSGSSAIEYARLRRLSTCNLFFSNDGHGLGWNFRVSVSSCVIVLELLLFFFHDDGDDDTQLELGINYTLCV